MANNVVESRMRSLRGQRWSYTEIMNDAIKKGLLDMVTHLVEKNLSTFTEYQVCLALEGYRDIQQYIQKLGVPLVQNHLYIIIRTQNMEMLKYAVDKLTFTHKMIRAALKSRNLDIIKFVWQNRALAPPTTGKESRVAYRTRTLRIPLKILNLAVIQGRPDIVDWYFSERGLALNEIGLWSYVIVSGNAAMHTALESHKVAKTPTDIHRIVSRIRKGEDSLYGMKYIEKVKGTANMLPYLKLAFKARCMNIITHYFNDYRIGFSQFCDTYQDLDLVQKLSAVTFTVIREIEGLDGKWRVNEKTGVITWIPSAFPKT